MYKMSEYLFNDRASVLHSEDGICQRLPGQFTFSHQITKWTNKLETVEYHDDDDDSNLHKQIFYVKVLTAFCKNGKNWEQPSSPN